MAVAILALAGPVTSHFEGRILATYRDPIGIITSCVGHTGPELKMGQTFTPGQCQATFAADQRGVLKRIASCTHGEAPVEVWAAMTVFSFNTGSGVFCSRFAPMIDRGDLAGACKRLSLYTYAGKVQLPGLITRRAAERALCEQGLL